MKMFDLPLYVFVYVNLFLYAKCSIPVEKLCVNHSCKEPISKAQGSVKYIAPDKHMLGFDRGQEITIISKSKNDNDYWEAIINGKIGYVPSSLIKEIKVFHKVSDLIPVPVQLQLQNESKREDNYTQSQVPTKNKVIGIETPPTVVQAQSDLNIKPAENPNSPSQTFNVIEGTTIYEDITPSSTADVKSTTQTATVEVPKNEKATLPPEVIKLNDNYRGQLDMKEKINIVFEKSDEDVKVESKDLDEEDEEEENDYEEEEGDEEDDEEDDGDEEKSTKEKETDIFKNETDILIQQKAQEREEHSENAEHAVTTENVTGQISINADAEKIERTEEATIAPIKEEKIVQIPSGPPSGWNLLNNFKPTPPPVDKNSENSDDKNVMPSVPQAIMIDVNQSESTAAEAVNKTEALNVLDPVAVDAASTQTFSSPPEPVAQDYTSISSNSLGATPSPPVGQNTIFNQFTASADTPPENTYHIQPKIEKATTEEAPVTSQSDAVMFDQAELLIDTPANEEKKELKMEMTTETLDKTLQPAIPETTTSNQFSVSADVPAVVQSASELPALKIIQEKIKAHTLDIPEVTEEPVPTEIPKVKVTEPAVTESLSSMSVTEEKAEVKEETTTFPESNKDSSLMSQITIMFSSWFTPTPKEQSSEKVFPDPQNFEKSDVKESLVNDIRSDTCESGFGFDCRDATTEQQLSPWISWIFGETGVDTLKASSNTFLYLVVTAVTVLCFTLGHNFIEKIGKTGPLIAKINKLEKELLVVSKECHLLKDEIQSARDKIILYENSANDELVLSLQAELEESKKVKAELESSIEVLQQELDAATEAGLDLNKMLSEVLTQKGGSETLLKSVESLQSQLDSQQRVIDEMTKKLGAKNEENEALQSALEAANERAENLEEQLNDIKHNLNLHLKEKENLTQDLNSQITQLKTRINQLGQAKEKEVAKLKNEFEQIQKKLSETTGALTVKEEELKSLKEVLKKINTKQDLKLDAVFDVCKVNGELAKEKKENQVLTEKLQKEESDKKALADSVKLLDAQLQKLKKAYEEAEQKKDEAEKKLEVLSTYFKEKETQLQKELGLQEALWAQKKGDEKAVYNMMRSLQEEVESYKSQNETLKKEILDQERGLKSQMATLEQKAHENWVAARQAERKLEEAKQEMAQLRNRLILVEKNSANAEGRSNFRSSEELNGVDAASPILHDTSSPLLFPPLPLDSGNSNLLPPGFMPPPMFMPPPIGGFMPPPPFLPGDRRPPPLGRMSSPPLNNRFSPSSAEYPFERMSSPPLSPSTANYRSPNEERDRYRHRSPPYPPPPLHPRNWDDNSEMPGFIPISSQRDSRRDHKGSNISSEHSSSESLDKSSRHSGRV